MAGNYALGMDFGTESVRFLLVDTNDSSNTASEVVAYEHGVIDKTLPGIETMLPADWALQHPADWMNGIREGVRKLLETAEVRAEEVIGIGIDFTSCTMLPVDEQGIPLCLHDKFAGEPHAWPKLWKHHASQPQADSFNHVARETGFERLDDFGSRISSEWMIPKALQILQEKPEIYDSAASFMEAGDWIVRQLTGAVTRNSCAAGYKSLWAKGIGFPNQDLLGRLDPRFASFANEKLGGKIMPPGECAGRLQPDIAAGIGLVPGTPVGAAIIDAHSAVLGSGVVVPGKMVLVVGTSTCHMLLGDKKVRIKGIAGAVDDGIVAGFCGYEAGQAATGDILVWLVRRLIGDLISDEIAGEDALFARLEEQAIGLEPGSGGLVALDWWNGNRSVLMDANLSGLLIGLTLDTSAAQIYRAPIEATGFGTRRIIAAFEDEDVAINELYLCGGLARKSKLLRQVYADICGRELHLAASDHASALGAAMLGAVAAGKSGGGFDSLLEAAEKIVPPSAETIQPNPEAAAAYNDIYSLYLDLHDQFGIENKSIMRQLKSLPGAAWTH